MNSEKESSPAGQRTEMGWRERASEHGYAARAEVRRATIIERARRRPQPEAAQAAVQALPAPTQVPPPSGAADELSRLKRALETPLLELARKLVLALRTELTAPQRNLLEQARASAHAISQILEPGAAFPDEQIESPPDASAGFAAIKPVPARVEPQPTGPRVLIVEDDPVNQRVASTLVGRFGYSCLIVSRSVELQAFLKGRNFDLVLINVQMPGVDAVEVARFLRGTEGETEPHIPVVALTTHPRDRDRHLEAGLDDCLAKPLLLDKTRAVLHRWLPPSATVDQTEIFKAASPKEGGDGHAFVDYQQLRAMTGGGRAHVAGILDAYFSETELQLEQMKNALDLGLAGELAILAQKCAGASGTCGMLGMLDPIHKLEKLAIENRLSDGFLALVEASAILRKSRDLLEPQLRPRTGIEA